MAQLNKTVINYCRHLIQIILITKLIPLYENIVDILKSISNLIMPSVSC